MERVLNASRYAGFDLLEMKRGNLEDQIEFRKFLEEEIYKEKSVTHENRERRGEELFNIMLEFTRRFEKDKNIRGKNEAPMCSTKCSMWPENILILSKTGVRQPLSRI